MAEEEKYNSPSNDEGGDNRTENFENKYGNNRQDPPLDDEPSNADDSEENNNDQENVDEESEESSNSLKDKISENETIQKIQDSAQQMRQAIEHGTRALQALISMILNPVTWVVIACIMLILATMSFVQIVGQNENACLGGDDTSSDTSAFTDVAATSGDVDKNANTLMTWLMKTNFPSNGNKPFSKEEAAGAVGNMMQESTLNPAITQNGFAPKLTNDQAIAMGEGQNGKAIGLFQWDGPERLKLAQFAKAHNKPWQDMGLQLTYAQTWLDKEKGPLLKAHFYTANPKTAAEYAVQWNNYVEISGTSINIIGSDAASRAAAGTKQREAYANDFYKKFKPTSDIPTTSADAGGDDGAPAACSSEDSNFDASGIVKLAESIAWPRQDKDKADSHGDAYGKQYATPGYIAAKDKAMKIGGTDEPYYASCDRFAATVIKLTVDKNVPWGATDTQHDYFVSHPNLWKPIHSKAELKPGDVLVTNVNGHIAIYLGMYQGIDSMASASFTQHTGLIGDASYWDANLRDTGGRQYTGFRFIGTPSGGGDSSDIASTSEEQTKTEAAKK